MTTPSVSVIVPAFNAAAYIGDAVASVHAQTTRAAEIIVVDDGSDDDTAAIAGALDGVLLVRQAHQGIAAARNRGVQAARGEYLAFLDADDLYLPEKLTRQLAHLRAPHGPDMSVGHVEEFVSADADPDRARHLQPRPGTFAGGVPGAVLLSRGAFDRVGPFASTWRVGEFADWYLRARDLGMRIETLADVVLRRRLHGGNVGLRERDARADYARIMKAALDRRRAHAGTRA